MEKIVFATRNPGKLIEMQVLLASLSLEVCSAEEEGVFEDIEETGDTLQENALIKARYVSKKTNEWAVADDTGLFIAALGGKPGIYAARWAGKGATANQVLAHTLKEMRGILQGERQAYFESDVALVSPLGEQWMFIGRVDGMITTEAMGYPRPRLPYDQIFIPKGFATTFAQMKNEEKNGLSHRGIAFAKLRAFLLKKG